MAKYGFDEVSVIYNNKLIRSGISVTVTPRADKYTAHESSDGVLTNVRNAGYKNYDIELVLSQSSPDNGTLMLDYQADVESTLSIIDTSGNSLYVFPSVPIYAAPAGGFEAGLVDRTWKFTGTASIYFEGGN